MFFSLSNICCSSQTTGQNAVSSPEARNFILCCPKFLPCGRIILNICSPQNKVNTPKCFPFFITQADYSWTLCSSIMDGGRAQIAKVRLVQNFWEEKGCIYVTEVRTVFFWGLIFWIQKAVHWDTHKKNLVFVLSHLRI